ncbi:hypothetical protein P5673_014109, partial [Acropora cervicornis]
EPNTSLNGKFLSRLRIFGSLKNTFTNFCYVSKTTTVHSYVDSMRVLVRYAPSQRTTSIGGTGISI